jgi:hypothetical protein
MELDMTVKLSAALQERLKAFLPHNNLPAPIRETIDQMRQHYVDLAAAIVLALPGESISKTLALTHLQDSLMRALQALELLGTPDVEEPPQEEPLQEEPPGAATPPA